MQKGTEETTITIPVPNYKTLKIGTLKSIGLEPSTVSLMPQS